jgi:hypothetical protein
MEKSNGERVFQTICDLHVVSRIASRQVISQMTGMKMAIVDDHIKSLRDKGKIRTVVNGIFEPIFPEVQGRAVSVTTTSDGKVKLEIGDQVLDLTMREARDVGASTAGFAILFGML